MVNGDKVILPSGNITLKVGVLAGGRVSGVVTRTYEIRKFSPYQMTVYVNTDKVGWNNCYFWTWGGDGTHGAASASGLATIILQQPRLMVRNGIVICTASTRLMTV